MGINKLSLQALEQLSAQSTTELIPEMSLISLRLSALARVPDNYDGIRSHDAGRMQVQNAGDRRLTGSQVLFAAPPAELSYVPYLPVLPISAPHTRKPETSYHDRLNKYLHVLPDFYGDDIVFNLQEAASILTQLAESEKLEAGKLQVDLHILYGTYFDKLRTRGMRLFMYSNMTEGREELNVARKIGSQLMGIATNQLNDQFSYSTSFPGEYANCIPLTGRVHGSRLLNWLNQLSLDVSENTANSIIGMAYKLWFDSPELMAVINRFKEEYPEKIRALIVYHQDFAESTQGLYSDFIPPSETQAISALKANL